MKFKLDKPKWVPVAGLASAALGVMFPLGMGVGVADTPAGDPIEFSDEFAEPDAGDIASMIESLSDESYESRQSATIALWQLGSRVLPELRKAIGGADPEASDRASELVLYISAGVLFDSPEEVKKLVLKFSAGDINAKRKILAELGEMGQWKQVLHLAHMEQDPKTREQLSADVRKITVRAAREAVIEGEIELVDEIFQMSGEDDQALTIKAWFYCQRGLLKQQLAMADAMPEKEGSRWRLALYRASGDLDEAIREAKGLGYDKLVDSLTALAGDPVPWLKRNTERYLLDQVLNRSCLIQMARLSGDEKKATSIARELIGMVDDADNEDRVIIALVANGFRDEALGLLEKRDPVSAFDFHDSSESPARALEALGIPANAKPPYTEWVRWFTSRAVDEELEDDYVQILMLAGFLVRHGEGEHAMAVINPLMEALEETGDDMWFELIGMMPSFELGPQAVELIQGRGNEDGEADLAVKKMLDTENQVTYLWNLLKKRNNQDLGKALNQLALLAGLLPDADGETEALHQALWGEMKDAAITQREERGDALLNFSIRRHEIGKASEIVDVLAPSFPRWKITKLYLDTTFHRWAKVEPYYEAHEKRRPGDYMRLTKWAMVLRKLDRNDKAREVLDRALLLSMGDIEVVHRIGAQLSAAGYRDEAYSLSLKAAMMAEPGSGNFDVSVVYLASHGALLAQRGDWKQAASMAEIYSRFTMRGRSNSAVLGVLNTRFNADFFRGMDLLLHGDRALGLKLLDSCQQCNPGSGALADEFFPALRKVEIDGVGKSYERWFEDSYQHVLAACNKFPNAANSQNTAAWLASRAVRRLDDAMNHAQKAVTLRPNQGAYLDTMAEVWFAKGNREKAVEWSEKAVQASISHAQGAPRSESRVLRNHGELLKQLERFKHGEMPVADQP